MKEGQTLDDEAEPRLLAGHDGTSAELRALLRAEGQGPGAEALARIAAGVAGRTGVPLGDLASAPVRAPGFRLGKLVGLGVACVVSLVAAWQAAGTQPDTAITTVVSATRIQGRMPAAASRPAGEGPDRRREGAAKPHVAPAAPGVGEGHQARASRASAVLPVPGPQDELALLERAQVALREKPSQALRLAGVHRKRFSRGQFVPEREMIAIEAQVVLGRMHAARLRAQRFQKAFPRSPHLPRLRELLSSRAPPRGP